MAKLNYFSVSFSDPRKNDQIVKGQTYKTVAKRFWGDNLKFNVIHENKEMGIVDVQILKKYAEYPGMEMNLSGSFLKPAARTH